MTDTARATPLPLLLREIDIPIAAVLRAPPWTIVEANPRFLRTYVPDGVSVVSLQDVLADGTETATSRRDLLAARLEIGDTLRDFPVLLKRMDGPDEEALLTALPLIVGEVEHYVVALRDVDEPAGIRQQLHESQRAMRTLFSNLPGMVYRCANDPDWTMYFVSEGAIDLTGYSPDELMSGEPTFAQIILPQHEQQLWETVQAAVKARESFRAEYRITAKDGSVRWMWEQGRGVFGSDGQLLALEGFITDITHRKEAEQSMAASQATMRAIVDSKAYSVALLDPDGLIVEFNESFRRNHINDYKADPKPGDDYRRVVPESYREQFERAFTGALVGAGLDTEFHHADTDRWFEMHMHPAQARDEVIGVCVTTLEITARKRDEAGQLAVERELAEARKLESLGLMAGGIAHDFNNLLTAIVGNASLARLEATGQDLPHALPGHLQQIELAARRARELTHQLLAYTGKGARELAECNLNDLIDETVTLMGVSIPPNVEVETDLDRTLPLIHVDAAQTRQVVMNLLLNAAEAIGDAPGRVTLTTDITRLLALPEEMLGDRDRARMNAPDGAGLRTPPELPAGKYARLQVRDTGSGMDAETIARVFDPFYSTKFAGRGLGLAVVQGIVKSHGGAITINSAPRQGTTFTVVLPAKRRLESEVVLPRYPQPADRGAVLVIDDEGPVRAVAGGLLRRLGYEVTTAADGPSGVEMYAERPGPIHCVLLDLTMPGMDGVATCRAIREIDPTAHVVLMSGYNAQDAQEALELVQANAFLQKPFTAADLASAMGIESPSEAHGAR